MTKTKTIELETKDKITIVDFETKIKLFKTKNETNTTFFNFEGGLKTNMRSWDHIPELKVSRQMQTSILRPSRQVITIAMILLHQA